MIRALRTLIAIATVVALAGCQWWPMSVVNRSDNPIVFQYLHRGYSEWSAPFDVGANEATHLAARHELHDVVGVKVVEGAETFAFSEQEVRRLEQDCSRSWLDQRSTFGECFLIYLGKGEVRITKQPPPDLRYRQAEPS